MTGETAPLPPPPPPPPAEEPPSDAATANPATGIHPSAIINQSTLASACTTLERLRSLHSEREACTLFASSLLAHPLGASGVNGNESNDGEGEVRQNNAVNALLDPLHPSSLPGGVRDAWASLSRSGRPLNVLGGEVDDLDEDNAKTADVSSALAEGTIITASMIENELAKEKRHENEEYTLNNGQLSIACRTTSLKAAMAREGELVNLLEKDVRGSGEIIGKLLEGARKEINDASNTYHGDYADPYSGAAASTELMNSFYERVKEVKEYHSQNNVEGVADPNYSAFGGGNQVNNSLPMLLSGQKRKHGHPLADGYDIASLIATETAAVRSGEVYTPEELFGKYLDLGIMYEGEVRNMRHAFASSALEGSGDADNNGSSVSILSYLDFLSILSKGLNTSISESAKLRDRRKYARFLLELEKYLTGFLKRTSPFLNVAIEVIAKAIASFEMEWGEKGCVDGWECRMAEATMVLDNSSPSDDKPSNSAAGIDLSKYATSSDLEKEVNGDELKSELACLGLKCGGTVSDRAARLFLTKDTPLDKLPAKVFAKKKGAGAKKAKTDASMAHVQNGTSKNVPESIADRRVDIARLEAIVSSLLDQLRPTLEGTRRRIERRTTQTENERDQELEEEINGAPMDDANPRGDGEKGGGNDSADEEDEEDAPIYNPKNVPLGWDGKPIPYWLFKLHGLNHFYPCEICGNESYRGRRNFEKHFTESRHSYGMRCLSIPNTKHFHGVTKIVDAQELWGRLRTVLEGNQFDVDQEEEYEDSHGNVLNRAQYEDLARQGLL
eukprot:CAMPEP_0202031400 /NCGR_PEP_ID=MMETSP0905-20130828/64995_1 /ASSEMBLY_ACC=CAM_ASM_000554 /TAXON_ID=420261 /ORGANISM="Thalassiosira antarctica, Strain CCMP982" /LENGTH=786 /DNA_ID=CAMNT_0048595237 /DNA_START=37 /DNA_END=2396 /DNA_ORIENTATION=-